MITTDQTGFTAAYLKTDNHARLAARFVRNYSIGVRFAVSMPGLSEYSYDEPACREAVEFFTKLADELNRRAAE